MYNNRTSLVFTWKSLKKPKNTHKVRKKVLNFENKANIRVDKVEKGVIIKSQKQMFVRCLEVNIMTSLTIFRVLFCIFLTVIGCYTIIHEKELAQFERKAGKYIKAFAKAVYFTFKEKKNGKIEAKSTERSEKFYNEYDEILSRLAERETNKSAVEEVLVA